MSNVFVLTEAEINNHVTMTFTKNSSAAMVAGKYVASQEGPLYFLRHAALSEDTFAADDYLTSLYWVQVTDQMKPISCTVCVTVHIQI